MRTLVKPDTYQSLNSTPKHHATYASLIWAKMMKKQNYKTPNKYTWYDALRTGGAVRRFLNWFIISEYASFKYVSEIECPVSEVWNFDKQGDFMVIMIGDHAITIDLRSGEAVDVGSSSSERIGMRAMDMANKRMREEGTNAVYESDGIAYQPPSLPVGFSNRG